MRGSPIPHPALLVLSNTKWVCAVTVDISLVGISEGPGVNIAYRRSHLAKFAMRGSAKPHPALLVFSSTEWMYAVTADKPIVGISEGQGVNIVYSRSHFANTQYEAVRGRIPPY